MEGAVAAFSKQIDLQIAQQKSRALGQLKAPGQRTNYLRTEN